MEVYKITEFSNPSNHKVKINFPAGINPYGISNIASLITISTSISSISTNATTPIVLGLDFNNQLIITITFSDTVIMPSTLPTLKLNSESGTINSQNTIVNNNELKFTYIPNQNSLNTSPNLQIDNNGFLL